MKDLKCYRCSAWPCVCQDGQTIIWGDCREVLPLLEPVDAVIVDPVWPNATPAIAGSEDPYGLWSSIVEILPMHKRLVVWLGCQSDPRFLGPIPDNKPFLRMAYLRRAVPGYNGRCLVTGDVIYAFGEWPPTGPGRMVIPGECSVTSVPSKRTSHPCSRNYTHAKWVVKWWSAEAELVLDCCLGVGTTLRACKDLGRRGIGIEIERKYVEIACRRLQQGVLEFSE